MNPIKQLIMWHINFLTPKLFGSLLGGLFGGDRPDAPTLESMTAKSAGTQGPLWNTKFMFDPSGKTGTSTATLTGTGRDIANRYKGLADTAQSQYQDYDVQDFAGERQGMINKLLGAERMASQNRLFDRVGAMTGGLTATSGGRDILSRGAAEQDLNATRAAMANLDSAYDRENLLFGRQAPAIGDYSNFMQSGEALAGRDRGTWGMLSQAIGGQRQTQYESDTQDWADDMSFWNSIGDSIEGYATAGMSNYANTGSIFGGMGGGMANSSAANTAFSGISGYNANTPFGLGYNTGVPQRTSLFQNIFGSGN